MRRVIYPLLFAISYLGNRFWGLDRTIRAFEAMGRARLKLGMVSSKNPSQLRAELASSYGMLPLAVRCLDQAVVTWYLLNLHGQPAEMKIGVTLAPFMSHAWVELGSETFVDFVHIKDMQVVAQYGAWKFTSVNKLSRHSGLDLDQAK